VNTNRLQLEVAVLHEQKTAQQDKLDALNAELKNRQELEVATFAKHQDQLLRQETDNKYVAQMLELRAQAAERNFADAHASAQQLRAEIGEQSLAMSIPSATHKEQIDALEARLREKDVLLVSLRQRADTISERYKEGDLVSNCSKPLSSATDLCVRTTLKLHSPILLSTRLKLFTNRKMFPRLTSYEEYIIFVFLLE
jgi:hypothetical protein